MVVTTPETMIEARPAGEPGEQEGDRCELSAFLLHLP
jgi:hypothetical protein